MNVSISFMMIKGIGAALSDSNMLKQKSIRSGKIKQVADVYRSMMNGGDVSVSLTRKPQLLSVTIPVQNGPMVGNVQVGSIVMDSFGGTTFLDAHGNKILSTGDFVFSKEPGFGDTFDYIKNQLVNNGFDKSFLSPYTCMGRDDFNKMGVGGNQLLERDLNSAQQIENPAA